MPIAMLPGCHTEEIRSWKSVTAHLKSYVRNSPLTKTKPKASRPDLRSSLGWVNRLRLALSKPHTLCVCFLTGKSEESFFFQTVVGTPLLMIPKLLQNGRPLRMSAVVRRTMRNMLERHHCWSEQPPDPQYHGGHDGCVSSLCALEVLFIVWGEGRLYACGILVPLHRKQ